MKHGPYSPWRLIFMKSNWKLGFVVIYLIREQMNLHKAWRQDQARADRLK